MTLAELEARLVAVEGLLDFAMANGEEVPDDVVRTICTLDKTDVGIAAASLLIAEAKLAKVTRPWTTLNFHQVTPETVLLFKVNLFVIAGLTFVIAFLSALDGHVVYQSLATEKPLFLMLIFLYGTSLGATGACLYELFHISGALNEREYRYYDSMGNYSRIISGGILGWLFVVIFAYEAIGFAMQFPFTGQTSTPAVNYAILAMPFLAGYSSAFVTGLLSKLIDGARTTVGLDK